MHLITENGIYKTEILYNLLFDDTLCDILLKCPGGSCRVLKLDELGIGLKVIM